MRLNKESFAEDMKFLGVAVFVFLINLGIILYFFPFPDMAGLITPNSILLGIAYCFGGVILTIVELLLFVSILDRWFD